MARYITFFLLILIVEIFLDMSFQPNITSLHFISIRNWKSFFIYTFLNKKNIMFNKIFRRRKKFLIDSGESKLKKKEVLQFFPSIRWLGGNFLQQVSSNITFPSTYTWMQHRICTCTHTCLYTYTYTYILKYIHTHTCLKEVDR